jgi:hypothetical protein
VILGEGVAAGEVTIKNVSGVQSLHISGVGAGSVRLIGFAGGGPADKLVVAGVTYDIATLLNQAGGYGSEGILLTTRLPASYGSGGGGYTGGGGTGGGDTGGGTGGGGTGDPNVRIPPIVIDLDGDGVELIAAKKSGIYFDWNGDGLKDETGWAGPDDGFLVLDRNGDGQITSADEISFGAVYGKKDPFVSDLEGLRAFDSNGNGSLDAGDDAFAQFRVWRDANSNAVVDAGELLSLSESGLEALALDGYRTGERMNGKENVIYATTQAVFADNRTVVVGDVLLGWDAAKPQGDMDIHGLASRWATEPLELQFVV